MLDEIDKFLMEESLETGDADYQKLMNIPFPENLFEFLLCRKKKKQEQILRDVAFSTDSLQALIYRAFN